MTQHEAYGERGPLISSLRLVGQALDDLIASSIHTMLAVVVLYALLAFGLRWAFLV